MFKIFIAFIGVAALALVGAVFLVIWISGQTPIHVTESATLRATPPDAQELVDQGAVLLVHGEIERVHQPVWNTSDGSRPSTPWDVSDVPDTFWIQTPVTIDATDSVMVLRPSDVGDRNIDPDSGGLTFVVRGGELDGDRIEVDDGLDWDFEASEDVLVVLGQAEANGPNGPGWKLIRKYSVSPDGDTVLVWGEDEYEQPLEELLEEFDQASQ